MLLLERAEHDHRRLLVMRGAESIKNDLSLVVAELREELAEHERQKVDPEHIPAIQVDDIDFSYGPVQVLFDVDFEVPQGRGAGAARHERCRQVDDPAGDRRARHADRAATVRLHGTTITYMAPEQRVKLRHPAAARRQGRVPAG